MSLHYKLRVLSADGVQIETAAGQFNSEEAHRLARFVEFADDLAQTRFAREGHDSPIQVVWSAGGQASADLPPNEVISEFVHRLRPFVHDNEPTFFPSVRGILYRRIEAAKVRARLALWHKQYSGALTAESYQVTTDTDVVNSDATLELWLNAFEYHRDEDKRAAMERIYRVVPEAVCRAFFFDLLVSKAEAVLAMADFIKQMQSAPAARQP